MKQLISFGTIALCILGLASTSLAQDQAWQENGDDYPLVRLGEDIATLWCNACHIISHNDHDTGFDGAPPFPSLAPLVRENPDRFIAFLTHPHVKPMEAITISHNGITAILAYISSLDPPN